MNDLIKDNWFFLISITLWLRSIFLSIPNNSLDIKLDLGLFLTSLQKLGINLY